MNKILYSGLILLIIHLVGCDQNQKNEEETQLGQISGTLENFSDCKMFEWVLRTDDPGAGESCINWNYDRILQELTLNHINTGFNCCPGELSAHIFSSGDTIIIEENEEHSVCDCECLYDLHILVQEAEDKIYQVKFIEPYIKDQEILEFQINLSEDTSGSYCVNRTIYPWGP
ncbi:MAG: hypothetical protein JXJ22_16620 [Bacteroidales bacterium]|nr:hypothetical protein [Bacteroidales bacterium]